MSGLSDITEGMERIPLPSHLLQRARELRAQSTHAENLLWQLLRNRQVDGAKFRRQYSLPPYTLDFYCPELRSCVELDGGQHAEAPERDQIRDAALMRAGIVTFRFWNHKVLSQTEAVVEAIGT